MVGGKDNFNERSVVKLPLIDHLVVMITQLTDQLILQTTIMVGLFHWLVVMISFIEWFVVRLHSLIDWW